MMQTDITDVTSGGQADQVPAEGRRPPASAPAHPPQPGHGLAAATLADLVRGYLDGVTSIVEVAGPDAAVNLLLDGEAGDAGYRRVAPGEDPRVGQDTLAVVLVGPDPARHLSVEALGHLLSQFPDGARGLILLGYALAQLPFHQILSVLAAAHCLILDVTALDEANFPAAIVVSRVAAPKAEPSGGDSALRATNEYVLGRSVEQALQARLAEMERAGAGQIGPGDSGGQSGDATAAPQAGASLERDRLARALRSTQRELVGVYEKLMTLERSTSLEVGRVLVGVAQRPWREGARLPIDLYKMWRERGGAATLARRGNSGRADRLGTALTLLQDRGGPGLGDRWLAAYTTPGQLAGASLEGVGRLAIAGALTSLSCATLAPDATVHPLLPHDADFVLEGTGADLVLIETAAMLPGSAWAYAGDPAATDRGRRLAALVSLARSLGKPVVLLRNAPWHLTAGLAWLTETCDAVVDGDLGVQLARFNPIGLDPGRSCEPVYAACRDPREPPAVRRVLDELTGGGSGPVTVSGDIGWRSAPSRYRGHGLFVAATDAQAREQRAAGARVIGPVGHRVAGSGGAGGFDAARMASEITAGLSAGALGPAEVRPVLRELFESHATPARLAGLAQLAGLPAYLAPSRQIAVLAELPDASHAQRLGLDLMRQRLRPAEVIVTLTGQRPDADAAAIQRKATARALRALADAGSVIRVTAGTGLAVAAAAARAPWVAPWEPDHEHPDHYLLDLACALECSRADAVGRGAGGEYVFTQAIEPALARRDLLLAAAPPRDAWGRQGLAMLSVSP